MSKLNRLILGDGLLGSELIKQTGWDYISRNKDKFDFVDVNSYKHKLEGYDEIINCIGCTDTYGVDKNNYWNVNYTGVVELVDICNIYNKKLVHISTDYVYANYNGIPDENDLPNSCDTWYGYTKALSEAYVKLRSKDYLVVRSCHKAEPFIYEKAYINLVGNFDYVSVITKQIIDLVKGDADGFYNIGTEKKTMYDLAKQTKPDVVLSTGVFNEKMPSDVEMDLTKLKKFYNKMGKE
jgi:dTDP-4-dehydrorhamnose reductase